MSASAFAAELAAGKELENSLRYYDGSAKSGKAVESFNDADGFYEKESKYPCSESGIMDSIFVYYGAQIEPSGFACFRSNT